MVKMMSGVQVASGNYEGLVAKTQLALGPLVRIWATLAAQLLLYVSLKFQFARLEAGLAGRHWRRLSHLLTGDLLPVGIALPPSASRHPPPEEPEAEDQEQGQGQEQDAGWHAAVLRLHHPEEQDRPDPALLHRSRIIRSQHSYFLLGKTSLVISAAVVRRSSKVSRFECRCRIFLSLPHSHWCCQHLNNKIIFTPNRLVYWALVIAWKHPSPFELPFWSESLPWFSFFLSKSHLLKSQMQVCCKIKIELIKTSFRPRKSSYGENSPQGSSPSYFFV